LPDATQLCLSLLAAARLPLPLLRHVCLRSPSLSTTNIGCLSCLGSA
jgi:hypothetical protein